MAETKEEWKGYLIVRVGPFWKIRNCNRWYDDSFTSIDKAKRKIDVLVTTKETKEYNSALNNIKKIPDLKKRTKEYKKLCQTHQSS